jgi:hypothetical protein
MFVADEPVERDLGGVEGYGRNTEKQDYATPQRSPGQKRHRGTLRSHYFPTVARTRPTVPQSLSVVARPAVSSISKRAWFPFTSTSV